MSVNSRENSVNSRENSVNSRPPVWAWFSRVWKRILALVEHQCVELISCFWVLLRLLKNRGWLWSSQVGPGLVQPSNAVWALCPPFQWVWQRLMSLMLMRWNENLSSWRCGSGQILAGYDRRREKQISISIYIYYICLFKNIYSCIELGRLGCAWFIFKWSNECNILAQVGSWPKIALIVFSFPHPPNRNWRPPAE